MAYQPYRILRTNDTTKGFIFNDTPPQVDGVYVLPRQVFKLEEMEAGTVNVEYGVDRGAQVVTLNFSVVPEIVLKAWEQEYLYLDPTLIEQTYNFYDHRTPMGAQPMFLVKWKDMKAEYLRTLMPSDIEYWYEYFKAVYGVKAKGGLVDEDDLDNYGIADLYKVSMEFFVVNKPLYPNP